MEIYKWVVVLHVISAFGFFLAHGASALAMFKLRGERSPERICAIVELCKMGEIPMTLSLLGLFISGVAGGFMGGWWRYGWIWVSLILFIAIAALMGSFGRVYIERISKAVGMADPRAAKKGAVPPPPASQAELLEVLTSGRPRLLASIGLGGLVAIVLLMSFKPF